MYTTYGLNHNSFKHVEDEALLYRVGPPRSLREVEPAVGRSIRRRLAVVVSPVGRVLDLDARCIAGAAESVGAGDAVDAVDLWVSSCEVDVVVVQKLSRLGGCGRHVGLEVDGERGEERWSWEIERGSRELQSQKGKMLSLTVV